MTFEELAAERLQAIAENDDGFYKPSWDVSNCGQTFPLIQCMEITDSHPILGLKTRYGASGTASEYCYYLVMPEFTNEAYQSSRSLVEKLDVLNSNFHDCGHDYTIISLVIITKGKIEPKVLRQVRKYKYSREPDRSNHQFGWSVCRIGIMNLDTEEIVCSFYGDTLRNRLSGTCTREMSVWDYLKKFSHRD